MKQVRTIGVVRQRGQFTIPGPIRDAVKWLSKNGAVIITLVSPKEVRLEPFSENVDTDWDSIWEGIHYARKLNGGRKENLSDFVIRDRQERP